LYKAPRGTVDILPREQAYWRYVEAKAAELCQLYGYQRLDTPVFEEADLFTRSIGEGTDIVTKEMYIFKDRSGKALALKPEGTASICRAYIEHGMDNLPQPVKLYYLASVFRYERPQAGRYRQHYQFGCEAIGDADPALDVEVVHLACQLFASLGLEDLTVQLNSIGCKACRPGYITALKSYYAPQVSNICPDCKVRLEKNPLRLLDCKQEACQPIADRAPKTIDYLCRECEAHFKEVTEYLKSLGLPFSLNHRLVRGLDYYTKTVFEVQPLIGGAQSALGGGGRYDDLIEQLGGKPTPAVGFAVGIDRVVLSLKKQALSVPPLPFPRLFIAYLGDEAKMEAVKLAASLRTQGIGAIMAGGNRSLKAQLRQADSLGSTHAIIIGEEEIKRHKLTLRNMLNGEQQSVTAAELRTALEKTAWSQ
jgi:histidyl-tRNA synthetase